MTQPILPSTTQLSTPPPSSPIRVLIADDSAVMRAALERMIESDTTLQVVGIAADGLNALEQTKSLRPDVVTLDINMPRMNGLEALTRIMAETQCPVIIVSSLTCQGAQVTLEALDRGAFDFIPKPGADSAASIFDIRENLLAKIKSAAQSPLARRRSVRKAPVSVGVSRAATVRTAPVILAIGASTGGPKALQDILVQLPAQMSTGILIVQHMPVGFTAQFAERLNHLCQLTVRESSGEEIIAPATVYIAPAGWHMTVEHVGSRYRTHLSKSPSGTLHTPSVDVLMFSVASIFRNQGMGIILTGMGSDGARGMKAIHDAGGWTLGQDADSCAVYGMPRSAAEIGALDRVAPLNQIASEITAAFSSRSHPGTPAASAHTAR